MLRLAPCRFLCAVALAVALSPLSASCAPIAATAAPAPGAQEAAPAAPRPLNPEFLSRKAVAYSGYRGADHHTPPTQVQVLQDLRLLLGAGYGLIRVFGSSDADTRVVLQAIRDHHLDIKVQLGIWISGPKATSDPANQAEIARGIALATTFKDIVLAVSVGNETMVDWSMHVPPADIAGYLREVRRAVAQPVTTDDNWAVFADQGGKYAGIDDVLREMDFVSMHTYPLLDSVYDPAFTAWRQTEVPEAQRAPAMMDTFVAKAQADYAAVRGYLDAQGFAALPVTIGETGWKAFGPQADRIHPVNQKMYADRLAAWKARADGPRQIFWFEAFDEPWKGGDDGWGLFDVHRKARAVVQAQRDPSGHGASRAADSAAVHWRAP